jgi:hypothetical protein
MIIIAPAETRLRYSDIQHELSPAAAAPPTTAPPITIVATTDRWRDNRPLASVGVRGSLC